MSSNFSFTLVSLEWGLVVGYGAGWWGWGHQPIEWPGSFSQPWVLEARAGKGRLTELPMLRSKGRKLEAKGDLIYLEEDETQPGPKGGLVPLWIRVGLTIWSLTEGQGGKKVGLKQISSMGAPSWVGIVEKLGLKCTAPTLAPELSNY